MADDAVAAVAAPKRLNRTILIGVLAAMCLALATGYYLFLRTDYVVLYSDLKPADASAIVAELKAKGVAHRLRDQGTTILVPASESDTVRLAVAGSDIPMKGAVGFELFNKSDMGLTDFAQKINYQRALQGELARTIMLMDGIETARVHLAIPERALFRANRSSAKAAIEVLTRLGQTLDAARVAGIQQLVAAAVPDLALGDVVVLDGDGHVVSVAAPAAAAPEMAEQAAAQSYYSARARSALGNALPGLQADVKTLMLSSGTAAGAGGGEGNPTTFGTGGDGARNFLLRVTVLTAAALNAEDQARARAAVAAAVGLDARRGDSIAFEQGPVGAAPLAPIVAPAAPAPAPLAMPPTEAVAESFWQGWWKLLLAALFVAAGALLLVRLRQPALSFAERDAFVDRIRQQLGGNARA